MEKIEINHISHFDGTTYVDYRFSDGRQRYTGRVAIPGYKEKNEIEMIIDYKQLMRKPILRKTSRLMKFIYDQYWDSDNHTYFITKEILSDYGLTKSDYTQFMNCLLHNGISGDLVEYGDYDDPINEDEALIVVYGDFMTVCNSED